MAYPGQVALLAVNEVGHEGGIASMAALGDLPLLQDTSTAAVWASWAVTYRDVVLLDEANVPVEVYNLTTHDLNDPASYDALRALIEAELVGP